MSSRRSLPALKASTIAIVAFRSATVWDSSFGKTCRIADERDLSTRRSCVCIITEYEADLDFDLANHPVLAISLSTASLKGRSFCTEEKQID